MSADARSGVTSNALATAMRASRWVKVDPSRVTGMTRDAGSGRGHGQVGVVDLPVVEADTVLPGKDPQSGCGRLCPRLAERCFCIQGRESRRQVVAVRSPPSPSGSSMAASCSVHPSRRTSVRPSVRVLRVRVARAALSAAFGRGHAPLLHGRLDVHPALGEGPQNGLRDVGELPEPVASDLPAKTERRQLGPERRPVEGAGGLLPGIEVATIRCRPPAVCALDQIGDDDMGVELGIAGPAGAMTEGRRR